MAHGYEKKFTLTDIFNNQKLKGKIPLVNYKESVDENGKTHRKTNMESVVALLYNNTRNVAKTYYHPFESIKSGSTIIYQGTLRGDFNECYESVYNSVMASAQMLRFTANNMDMIRTALKEGQKAKQKNGQEPKLWLKYGSMQEIENLSKRDYAYLIDDIMRNIFYNGDFATTQKKYNVAEIPVGESTDYDRRLIAWKRKVGDL